jgi:lysophospholipase L1-like esterase
MYCFRGLAAAGVGGIVRIQDGDSLEIPPTAYGAIHSLTENKQMANNQMQNKLPLGLGSSRRLCAVFAIGLALTWPAFGSGQDSSQAPDWVATWGTSPSTPGQFGRAEATGPAFENRTLRQIVHTSVGGDSVRIRLSNRHGSLPLEIGAVHIASRSEGAQIETGSDRSLTFGTKTSITIPIGAFVLSDPVGLEVMPLADLAITIFFPSDTGAPTFHGSALQTGYISPPGNFTASAQITDAETSQSWFFLTAVEVKPSQSTGVVVTVGNSITDGTLSTADTNGRWPDHLASRLAARGSNTLGVVNAGIAGNRVLHGLSGFGVNVLARLELDVLSVAGVTHVVVLEGINDIGLAGLIPGITDEAVNSDEIIAGHRQLIARVHARGLKIYGATLTPYEGAAYFSAEGEVKRQAVNAWIRTSGAYDAVIDFDAATRDPNQPSRFRPGFSQDNLHPNDVGYEAMGDAIDLALFDRE